MLNLIRTDIEEKLLNLLMMEFLRSLVDGGTMVAFMLLLIPRISVTRLGDFLKFLASNFISKVAQIFGKLISFGFMTAFVSIIYLR